MFTIVAKNSNEQNFLQAIVDGVSFGSAVAITDPNAPTSTTCFYGHFPDAESFILAYIAQIQGIIDNVAPENTFQAGTISAYRVDADTDQLLNDEHSDPPNMVYGVKISYIIA